MKPISRRHFLKVGGGAVVGLAVIACGPEAPAPQTAKPAAKTDAPATKVEAPAAPAKAAARKDTLTIALPSNPENVDPNQTRAVLTGSIMRLIQETLVGRDADTMKLVPALATSWQSQGPNIWELKLRQGVKFHNGEEFNAEAVKFSLERGLHPSLNTGNKAYMAPDHFAKIEIVDAFTVRLHTKQPDPVLPSRLAPEPVSMMPPKAYAAFTDKYVTDKPQGTGPYRFVEYVVGDRFVVEANPDYWGPKPATKRIVWKVIPDAQTRVAALQRSEVDVVVNLPVPLIPIVEKEASLAVYGVLGSTTHALLINRSYAVARSSVGQARSGAGGDSPWRRVSSCQRSLTAARLSWG
ncbi:MAG: hypothetical protein HY329_04175, partial [Chloroflexi bacterium]|nr:hypothetical protein [Chloroflexota bacterium]